jgi:Protein of unknown function (DUF3102)
MSESKATGAVARNLSEIKADLRTALKSQTANGVVIGGLLREAKRGLKHGEWGMWLRANFALSERSAQHYMAASEFASKYERIADLKLRLTGICALTKYDPKDDRRCFEGGPNKMALQGRRRQGRGGIPTV